MLKPRMIGHRFRRLSQQLAIKIIRATDPDQQKDRQVREYDRETFSICHQLISKPETVLLMSPISGKRYIKSDDSQIFIVIQPSHINIVNHTYSYDIKTDGSNLYDRIVRVFDLEVEQRREQMEHEIHQNVKHSLKKIYETLHTEAI